MQTKATPPRVAMLVHTQYLLDPRVRREAEALAQKGAEVHVITLAEGPAGKPEPKNAFVNGVYIHRLPIRKKRGSSVRYLYEYFMTGLLGGWKLAALNFRGRLNVVHVHNMPDILILAALVPRLGGSKLVLDIHDPMPELALSSQKGSGKKFLVWLLRLQERIGCRFADHVISVNESMRENLRSKGVPDNKIFIVHNFPDQRVFPLRDIPVLWPRSRSGLTLLYCGTLTQHYDLSVFVKAIARLAGEIPVKLRIAGSGSELVSATGLAHKLGVANSLETLGVIPLDTVHEEMRQADVGISCQRGSLFGHLQFSTKIVEYLTQGLPVLTPQTSTVSKYLPEDSVFYFEPGNDAALADAIRFMWNNPAEVLTRLSRAARLLPQLSWQAEKERFLGFYAGLLQDPSSKPKNTSQSAPSPAYSGREVDDFKSDLRTLDTARAGSLTVLAPAPVRTEKNDPSMEGACHLDPTIHCLQSWVESHGYKAYEPFDGLSSCLRPLTFGSLFLDRILMQLVRQSPINLRPLLGIKPLESTKGRGYMAWGYLALLESTGRAEYRQGATACLEWLIQNKSPLYPDYSWANHFDFASRSGRYSKHESIIVWTALIGQAFLEGFETLGDERYLGIAKSICNWILKLPSEKTSRGTCLSYLARTVNSIHNSNMLGAAMLARTAKHTGNQQFLAVAKEAMEYSCSRQLPDGAWYYGENSQQHWIDNFHTGYNLDSLKCYIESTGDATYRPHLDLGYQYFKKTFFDESGRPGYYHNRPYPIDIQCAAQAIETFATFADYDEDSMAMALKVAQWTIDHMRDRSGYFYYRRYPLMTAKIPMLHWGQATMFRALALLRLKLVQRQLSAENSREPRNDLKGQLQMFERVPVQ